MSSSAELDAVDAPSTTGAPSRRTSLLLAEYLRARRAAADPVTASFGGTSNRRVPGLRRFEVAELAGVSPEYYVRLEQGKDTGPSVQVLRALARALQLDEVAVTHMRRLVEIQTNPHRSSPRPAAGTAHLHAMVASGTRTPAFVLDRHLEVGTANVLATALFPTLARPGFSVLDAVFSASWRRRDLDWGRTARSVVAALRLQSDPTDPELLRRVSRLSARDEDFRRLWARHEVAVLALPELRISYAPFGTVRLRVQVLEVAGSDAQSLVVLRAEPGSLAEATLDRLRARRTQEAG